MLFCLFILFEMYECMIYDINNSGKISIPKHLGTEKMRLNFNFVLN